MTMLPLIEENKKLFIMKEEKIWVSINSIFEALYCIVETTITLNDNNKQIIKNAFQRAFPNGQLSFIFKYPNDNENFHYENSGTDSVYTKYLKDNKYLKKNEIDFSEIEDKQILRNIPITKIQ